MNYILERLAVGDINDARNMPDEITALLNSAAEHDTCREGIAYLKIALVDFQPIDPAHIPRAVAWIKEVIVNQRVLVSLQRRDRQITLDCGVLPNVVGFGFEEAVRLVRARKPNALPHRDLKSAILLARRMGLFK